MILGLGPRGPGFNSRSSPNRNRSVAVGNSWPTCAHETIQTAARPHPHNADQTAKQPPQIKPQSSHRHERRTRACSGTHAHGTTQTRHSSHTTPPHRLFGHTLHDSPCEGIFAFLQPANHAQFIGISCAGTAAAFAINPATRNRTRDHLIAADIYSQMLYQLSYSRPCVNF